MSEVPYEGYNWSLTQHMGRASEEAIRTLLDAAYALSGETAFREEFAKYLDETGVFTANVREDSGRADAWRDYQQVLAELGLIESTALTRDEVLLTPIGLMLLDRSLSFEDIITTQAFRYQYPNGHKTTLPEGAREYGRRAGVAKRTELDVRSGVSVKPGIVILRALLDSHAAGDGARPLTVQECAAALIPVIDHADPSDPYRRLALARKMSPRSTDVVQTRNAAEWFSLLLLTGLFVGDRRHGIQLSDKALTQVAELDALCSYHEKNGFWSPEGEYPSYAYDWFDYFGNPSLSAMAQPRDPAPIPSTANPDETERLALAAEVGLAIVPFSSPPAIERRPAVPLSALSEESLLAGLELRHEKSRLHQELVAIARQLMLDAGYEVYYSPAVDLLCLRDGSELLVEVKTVTRDNLSKQLRLGTGQLMEYRYRRTSETGATPEALLLISGHADLPAWIVDFFRDEASIGLVYRRKGDRFGAYTAGPHATEVFLD